MYSCLTGFEGPSTKDASHSRVNVCHYIVFFLTVHIHIQGAKSRKRHAEDNAMLMALMECFVEIEGSSAYRTKNLICYLARSPQKSWHTIHPLVGVDQGQCLPERVEGENGAKSLCTALYLVACHLKRCLTA